MSRPVLVLGTPRPNPARRGEEITLDFVLPAESDVTLALYNTAGQRIAVRAKDRLSAGTQQITWRPASRWAGPFFMRLVTGTGRSGSARVVIVP